MKIILFDIDHTLLNTTEMAKKLYSMVAEQTGLSLDEVTDYKTIYMENLPHTTYYDFNEFIKTLPINEETANNVLDKYENESEIYTKYNDVDKVLKELKNKEYKIGIFSEGTPHFQYNKLKNLQIEKYLDKELIFICQSKRSDEYIESLPEAIIVDDNVDVCNILSKHKKHRIYHLNIKNKRYTPESGQCLDERVTSLDSLSELLDLL